MRKIKAIFIGKDGSNGYVRFETYNLLMVSDGKSAGIQIARADKEPEGNEIVFLQPRQG
jgi:hypothetical protein